jgi:L-Ala-D/L-Glu epimerase
MRSMPSQVLHVELKTLQLAEPFRIAHGVSTERTVLRLKWGEAVGEAPFVPYYKENPAETLQWLQTLAWSGGPAPSAGPRAGRLALDLLWHDYVGKERGQSVSSMWQLHGKPTPPGCRSFSIPQNLEDFAKKVKSLSQQFKVLKLKLGSGDLAFDEAIASTAMQAAPGATVFADANGGWTIDQAVQIIPKLAALGLHFVEQPVTHEGGLQLWRDLRKALPNCPLPLYADESTQSADDVMRYSSVVDGVNVKLLKCGTLGEARTMIQFAQVNGLKVMLGCMIESSIGITAAAHLAPLADWIDLDGHFYVANDDYVGVTYDEHGKLVMPDKPGLSAVLREL